MHSERHRYNMWFVLFFLLWYASVLSCTVSSLSKPRTLRTKSCCKISWVLLSSCIEYLKKKKGEKNISLSWKLLPFVSIPLYFPGKTPSHCPKNLSVASLFWSSKAALPEGVLLMCCINYKPSSWCPCKSCSVRGDVSHLQPLLISVSTCSVAREV